MYVFGQLHALSIQSWDWNPHPFFVVRSPFISPDKLLNICKYMQTMIQERLKYCFLQIALWIDLEK